jgi:hypothetical protein
VSPSGSLIRWSSVPDKVYDIERSSSLTSGFAPLPSGGITASSTTTEYTDSTASGPGPYFYRLRIKQ